MKIKRIKLRNFKRFSDLTIERLPNATKLVILVGPNGSGKTSLFDAMNHWYMIKGFGNTGDRTYFEKKGTETSNPSNWYQNKVEIEFYSEQPSNQIKGKFYFRTAYRHEPDFTVSNLKKQTLPGTKLRFVNLMGNDQTVSENYQRLVAQTLRGVYNKSNDEMSVWDLRNQLVGKIRASLSNIFDDLNLTSIGDPLSSGSFYFKKGTASDFHYKNLSAGEKSVFDLVLDLIIKSAHYSGAIFCIDEPEAHMHTKLQSKVLRELYNLTPINSQLWITTHSIGMLKEAEEIERNNPNSVVFLDFDNKDFDSTETIVPAKLNRTIWNRFFDLALADFSKLIAPRQIVFCEGTPKGRKYKNFDAQIYEKIFGENYPHTRFISIGSCSELENINNPSIGIIASILGESDIVKFVDRDDRSVFEIQELLAKDIKTSKRRHIESYLLDDEIIRRLCEQQNEVQKLNDCLMAKTQAIEKSKARKNPPDDIKSASGEICHSLRKILALTQGGNNTSSFLRDTMAPLITNDTQVYQELEQEIFG